MRAGFPVAAQNCIAVTRYSLSRSVSTMISMSSRSRGYHPRSHATGARNMSCFCPESARMIANGGSGGLRIISLSCEICALVAARFPVLDSTQENILGCIPRGEVLGRIVPSTMVISSEPAPRDSTHPRQTYPDPGNRTISRFVNVSFT